MDGFFLGGAAGSCKAVWRNMKDSVRVSERERSHTDLMYVHELLACLVDNTYALAKGRRPAISPEDLGYRVESRIDRLVVYVRVGDGPREGRGLLRMEDNAEPKKARYEEIIWPKYVVAVRGTIANLVEDIAADLQIVGETACQSQSLFQNLLNELSLLHAKTSDADGGVWVTGHSLGAFIAETATLRLAETEGIVLPTHLFNLPSVSPDVLLTKSVIGAANGLGTLYGAIPLFGEPLKYVCRRIGVVVTRELEEAVVHAITSVSPSTIENVRGRRRNLDNIGYVVHMYSNRRDSISNEFIERSMRPGGVPISLTALFQNAVFRDSSIDACHLIAPMILHTNDRAEGVYQAHKITQWFLYPPVNHTTKRVELQNPIN